MKIELTNPSRDRICKAWTEATGQMFDSHRDVLPIFNFDSGNLTNSHGSISWKSQDGFHKVTVESSPTKERP